MAPSLSCAAEPAVRIFVMAGLVPAIHVLLLDTPKDVDHRDKPGDDAFLYSERFGRQFHRRGAAGLDARQQQRLEEEKRNPSLAN